MLENLNIETNQNFSTNLEENFKKYTKKISMLLACEGIRVKPYVDGLPYFSNLSYEKKKSVLKTIEFYLDLCIEQVSNGYKIRDSLSFTWRAFSRLGVTPRSDLFLSIRDNHIVEIYSDENVQLFRNFNFFDYCSYTLEELNCLEWWTLFERESEMTKRLYDYASDIFEGKRVENFVPDLPYHPIRELRSSDLLMLEHEVELMGPLLKDRKPKALVMFGSAKLVHK